MEMVSRRMRGLSAQRLAQLGDAAVQRALGDDAAVPAEVDHLVAADGVALGAVQGHQHLHAPAVRGRYPAVELDLEGRRTHQGAGQREGQLRARVSFGQSATCSFIAKPSRRNHARRRAVPAATSDRSSRLNSQVRRDYNDVTYRGYAPPGPSRVATPAAAQDSAVRAAADAFGERVGTEQSGLYNESQVRGFDLNDLGAYRIDDAYFSRASPLNDPVLAGVGVRVGVNAARLAYPAPSGVVNYRLRSGRAGEPGSARRGFRDFGTRVDAGRRVVEERGRALRSRRRLRLAARRSAGRRGPKGEALRRGGCRDPGRSRRASGCAASPRSTGAGYDGDYAFQPADGALPPILASCTSTRPNGPGWSATELQPGRPLRRRASATGRSTLPAFRSHLRQRRGRLHHPRDAGERRRLGHHLSAAPANATCRTRAEARLGRRVPDRRAQPPAHRVGARPAQHVSNWPPASPSPSGPSTSAATQPSGVEQPWRGTRGEDVVEQVTGSVGYGLAWGDRLQLRFGRPPHALRQGPC